MDALTIIGVLAVGFIMRVLTGIIIYAASNGDFNVDLSKPHDHYD
jgi:hypothetical protein